MPLTNSEPRNGKKIQHGAVRLCTSIYINPTVDCIRTRAKNVFWSRQTSEFQVQTLNFSRPLSDGIEPSDSCLDMQSCSSSSSQCISGQTETSVLVD